MAPKKVRGLARYCKEDAVQPRSRKRQLRAATHETRPQTATPQANTRVRRLARYELKDVLAPKPAAQSPHLEKATSSLLEPSLQREAAARGGAAEEDNSDSEGGGFIMQKQRERRDGGWKRRLDRMLNKLELLPEAMDISFLELLSVGTPTLKSYLERIGVFIDRCGGLSLARSRSGSENCELDKQRLSDGWQTEPREPHDGSPDVLVAGVRKTWTPQAPSGDEGAQGLAAPVPISLEAALWVASVGSSRCDVGSPRRIEASSALHPDGDCLPEAKGVAIVTFSKLASSYRSWSEPLGADPFPSGGGGAVQDGSVGRHSSDRRGTSSVAVQVPDGVQSRTSRRP